MPILKERGYFWWAEEQVLPGKQMPETAFVAGELTIGDDGRVTLNLDGAFVRPGGLRNQTIKAHKKNYDFKEYGICGILNNKHNKVFLHGLMEGFLYQNYQVRDCFIGTKLFPYNEGNFLFNEMTVSLQGYEGWLCMNDLKFSGGEKEFSVTYKAPSNHQYPMDWGTLSLEFDISAPFYTTATDELLLKQTGFFKYAFDAAQPLSVIQKKHRLLNDLLVLLTNSERQLEWPTVFVGDGYIPYKYYFGRLAHTESEPQQHECWVVFSTIQETFGQLFSSWEIKHDTFGSGFYLYLATRRGVPGFIEARFLDLMMGLESFHRHKHSDMRDEEAVSMRETILAKIDDQVEHKWLCERLQWSHEPTAKKRLLQTLSELSLDINPRRLKVFAYRCVEARNSITHSTDDRMKTDSWKVLSDLDQKSDALARLYHLLLLHEIGVAKLILDDIFKRRFEIRVPLASVGLISENAQALAG